MSMTEVLSAIERMSEPELAEVRQVVADKSDRLKRTPNGNPNVRYADEVSFHAAKQHVFTEYDELLHRLAQ